jgi:hypothetical protein
VAQSTLRTELLAAVKDRSLQPTDAKGLVKAVVRQLQEISALGVTQEALDRVKSVTETHARALGYLESGQNIEDAYKADENISAEVGGQYLMQKYSNRRSHSGWHRC